MIIAAIILILNIPVNRHIALEDSLKRARFILTLEDLVEKEIKSGPYTVQRKRETISLTRRPEEFKRGFTLRGVLLVTGKKTRNIRTLKLTPSLTGKHLMDFYYFFPPIPGQESRFYLEISGDVKKRIIPLKKSGNLQRFQIPVDLDIRDRVRFFLEGRGLAVIGNPVFYREDEYSEKDLVFIVSADTLRYDHVGNYNSEKKCTPCIDAFAENAVVFENAYSTSSWTLPAHVSLFTGKFAHNHEMNHSENKKNGRMQGTLFEPLQKKFITVSFNDNLFLSFRFGFSEGFDCYVEGRRGTSNPEAARLMFRNAVNAIRQDRYHVPQLYFLHTYQIHSLFYPEDIVIKKFYEEGFLHHSSFDIMDFTKYGREQFRRDVTTEKRKEIIDMYDAGILTFDYRFGEFIDFLKKRKLYRRAMIILMSDHGEEFGEHDGWAHGHALYNELIKIPLIVKFPGNHKAGSRVEKIVSITDILPTIMEYYKIDHQGNADIQGISLLEAMENRPGQRTIFAYLAAHARYKTAMKTALITDRFKLIYNKQPAPEDLEYFISSPPQLPLIEFFDLTADPGERINRRSAYRRECSKMFRLLKSIEYSRIESHSKNELEKELKTLGYIQ